MDTPLKTLPEALRDIITPYKIERNTVGWSADAVYKLTGEDDAYLKVGTNLKPEYERLHWLQGRLPVPKILYYGVMDCTHYLLMSAIPGQMVHEIDLPNQKKVELLAEGAKMFHALPIEACPFDWRVDAQLAFAKANVEAGGIDPDHFATTYHGQMPEDLLNEAIHTRPKKEDLVVVHGDYCMPNVLIDPVTEQITGFIDLGDVGVADRFVDLGYTARSITYNIGSMWIDPFMEAYGMAMNRAKYKYYTLLSELF